MMESDQQRQWVLGGAALITLVAVIWVYAPRWRTYPEVTHPQGIELIRMLHTATSSGQSERLVGVRQSVQQAKAAGQLTAAENEAFERVLKLAESGDWSAATEASLQFAKDQLRR